MRPFSNAWRDQFTHRADASFQLFRGVIAFMKEDEGATGNIIHHQVPVMAIAVSECQWIPALGDAGDQPFVIAPGQFDGKADELFGATEDTIRT